MVFVGRELQISVPGAVQGEWEGIELSHPVHSLSTHQKSPDVHQEDGEYKDWPYLTDPV